MADALLKLPEVREKTRKSTTRIYADMAAGKFPRPIKIGQRAVAWRERDVDRWLDERARDAGLRASEAA
jgi:prophage regulatory protein